MLTIAVTGGVACGKSLFCRSFAGRGAGGTISLFSCDDAVRGLYGSKAVQGKIASLAVEFGADLGGGGELDRGALRELLFENSQFRGKVEQVLHPMVLRQAVAHATGLSGSVRILLVEVPLLYEVEFPINRDLDVAVGASEATQEGRLLEDRGFAPRTVRRMLRAQLPIEEKIKRADIVVWNDGSLSALEAQIDHLFTRCQPLLNS